MQCLDGVAVGGGVSVPGMSKKQKKAARVALLNAQQQGGGGGSGKKKGDGGGGGGGPQSSELNPDDYGGEWVDVGTMVALSLIVTRKRLASFGFKVKMEDRLLVSAVIPNGPAEKVSRCTCSSLRVPIAGQWPAPSAVLSAAGAACRTGRPAASPLEPSAAAVTSVWGGRLVL